MGNGLTICANNQYCPSSNSIPNLQWDDGLATLAQDFSSTCRTFSQGHEYNDVRAARFSALGGSTNFNSYSAGENLAWGGNSVVDAVQRWGENEAVDYTYNTAYQGGAGHFTQIIWDGTQYVGCGWKQCSGSGTYGGILTCNYYPPGNGFWNGKYPYVSGNGGTVTVPTPKPTTAPPTFSSGGSSSGGSSSSDCITVSDSWWSSKWNGVWTKGSDQVNGKDYYTRNDFYIQYSSGWGKYIIAASKNSNSAYGTCDSDEVLGCVSGKWSKWTGQWESASARVEASSCSGAFENDDSTMNGTSSDNGWRAVMIVVVLGFVLIGIANAAFCIYMKKRVMVKHNMDKVFDEKEIEVQMDVSDEETAAVTTGH